MAITYFQNPEALTATLQRRQFQASMIGAEVEMGTYGFTTTGTTDDLPTYFSKILSCILTWTETTTVPEQLFSDLTVTEGAVTISRVAPLNTKEFHFPLDEGQISSNNYVDVPLMIAQSAMTLTQVEFFKGTAFGGGDDVTMNLGSNSDNGKYLEDIAVNETANTTDTTTSFSSGTAAVADGADIWFLTENGDTSGPGDGVVSISATTTQTGISNATFSYVLFGLH